MPKKRHSAEDPAELRRRAESRLRDQQTSRPSKSDHPKSEAAALRQLHELEVHQIELEMQNEELTEARAKMEILKEKYSDLYDFAPLGYLTLDQTGSILEANLAASNLLEVARSALVNRRFGLFLLAADLPAFGSFLKNIFASRVRQSCAVTLTIEGRPPLALDLDGIAFESGQACRMTLKDVTERKRAEADRLVLNKLESTGILAGGIAHDFNNLLTVILLNLELAQQPKLPDKELQGYLAGAKKSALMTKGLTAQLLTFAEGGAPIPREVRISGLIRESVRLALSGSNVRYEFNLAEGLWHAEVDEAQMGQVIRSMALNAREAMPRGGAVLVRAENEVLSATERPPLPTGDYVKITIADEGPGIPQDVLPKIFDPYFSTKQRGDHKGMGLGLTICHSIVQKHHGAITVNSKLSAGTTFDIYLPAARKFSSEDKASTSYGVPQLGRVLVMDDEDGVREIIGRTLSGMGHTVELAQDGQMAIELCKAAGLQGRGFDVVILDLTIRGGMGGRETLQELLKIDPRIKAIAMSGYALDPVILAPERHGFKGVLTKPFDAGKMRENLARILYNSTVRKTAP